MDRDRLEDLRVNWRILLNGSARSGIGMHGMDCSGSG
jgi:hypothetical protein